MRATPPHPTGRAVALQATRRCHRATARRPCSWCWPVFHAPCTLQVHRARLRCWHRISGTLMCIPAPLACVHGHMPPVGGGPDAGSPAVGSRVGMGMGMGTGIWAPMESAIASRPAMLPMPRPSGRQGCSHSRSIPPWRWRSSTPHLSGCATGPHRCPPRPAATALLFGYVAGPHMDCPMGCPLGARSGRSLKPANTPVPHAHLRSHLACLAPCAGWPAQCECGGPLP